MRRKLSLVPFPPTHYFRQAGITSGPHIISLLDLSGAVGATREALIAAFCRREKSLSYCWEKGWLVGAVGIEPTTFGLKGRCSTTELRP